jgi:hypothetical protein
LHCTESLVKTNLAKENENARKFFFFIRNPKLLGIVLLIRQNWQANRLAVKPEQDLGRANPRVCSYFQIWKYMNDFS